MHIKIFTCLNIRSKFIMKANCYNFLKVFSAHSIVILDDFRCKKFLSRRVIRILRFHLFRPLLWQVPQFYRSQRIDLLIVKRNSSLYNRSNKGKLSPLNEMLDNSARRAAYTEIKSESNRSVILGMNSLLSSLKKNNFSSFHEATVRASDQSYCIITREQYFINN